MGKAKSVVLPATHAATIADYKSIKDMAYSQAKTGDTLKGQAQWAIEHIAGFPAECPDESRAELNSGYLLRYMDNHPEVTYARIDGNYIKVTESNAEQLKDKEKVNVSAAIAMSFSTHAFGRLNETHDAQFKAIIKEVRDDVSDYCSTCFKALKLAATKIINKGKTRQRGATKNFNDKLKEVFDGDHGLGVNVRNANKRGDPTADIKRFTDAKIAFFAVWNHAE